MEMDEVLKREQAKYDQIGDTTLKVNRNKWFNKLIALITYSETHYNIQLYRTAPITSALLFFYKFFLW